MKNKFKKILLVVCLSLAFFATLGFVVHAQDLGVDYAQNIGLASGGTTDVRLFIVNIVRYALSFLAIIAVVIVMYGGFVWMTANGESDRVQKAKQILISSIIGLIIILSAFAIVTLVVNTITGSLEGGCTDGASRSCGCAGTGSAVCSGGVWSSCSSSCGSGQTCCSWGCSDSCATAPEFNTKSTIPADGSENAPRNTKVIFNFNRSITASSYADSKYTITDIASGNIIAGGKALDGRRIVFTPTAACGENECGAVNCFAPGQRVRAEIEGGAGGILSIGDIPLSCPGAGVSCQAEFTIGDKIDCDTPKVSLDFNQVCAVNDNELYANASDANGISQLEFFVDGASLLDSSNPVDGEGLPSISTRPGNPVYWDASKISPGMPVTIKVEASDVDSHVSENSRTYSMRPAHCCNNTLDAADNEQGVDCGGECAGCEGAACGISLYQSCADGNCDDSKCAAGLCACSDLGAAACSSAGYAGGMSDCCVCQDAPIIDYIAPQGGFCRTNPAIYCGNSDKVCDDAASGDICDLTTANASPGSLVTINGRYFGEYAAGKSKVEFDGIEALLADSVNAACGRTWQDSEIIIVMPAGTGANPVITVTAGSNYYDTTQDARGAIINFQSNNIERPGLCMLDPSEGFFEDIISFQGVRLENSIGYFGSFSSGISALNSSFSTLGGTAAVPSLSRSGTVTVFVKNTKNVASNYLSFKKLAEKETGPYIVSFSPTAGAIGQYITVSGGGFGAKRGNSRMYFDLNPDDAVLGVPADFIFPKVCADHLWGNNQILAKVPAGLASGEKYFIVLDLEGRGELIDTADVFSTGAVSPARFSFDSTSKLAPSLCKVDPVRGTANSKIGLWGEYFGAYDAGGNSQVVFYDNKIQSGLLSASGIMSWESEDDYDKISVAVPAEAITGPVAVVKDNDLKGNGLNFFIGECQDDSDCANNGIGGVCCPLDSPETGRCATDKNSDNKVNVLDCYGGLSSSVFEWQFTSGDGGGGIDAPCRSDATAPSCPVNPACSAGLVCDPTSCSCQLSCDSDLANAVCDADDESCSSLGADWTCGDDCFCEKGGNGSDSCQGLAERTGSCATDVFCPNSPGQCSPYAGTKEVASGDECSDKSCTMAGCTSLTCKYEEEINTCVGVAGAGNLAVCSKKVSDIFNADTLAYCAVYPATGESRWQIDTSASCPSGWFNIGGGRCAQSGQGGLCSPCALGLDCRDYNADGNGECVAPFSVCPSGYACQSGACVKDGSAVCECCCRIGSSEQDCCVGLTCAGECGTDRVVDNNQQGLCTGCRVESGGIVDVAASDAACNCSGTAGKFCDTDFAINGVAVGACKDCSASVNSGDCSIHDSVCCVDGADSNDCRGVGAGDVFNSGGVSYCAYYDCTAAKDSCDSVPKKTGAYDAERDCQESCISIPAGSLGLTCSNGNPSLKSYCNTSICLNPFSCLTDEGVETDENAISDCGVCCCDPSATVDQCKEAGYPNLSCVADRAPCDGGERGLCCGCESDSDCGSAVAGCGADTCCRARPEAESSVPADNAENVCRNAEISLTFNQLMDKNSFPGNVIVVGQYDTLCPAGTEYLAVAGRDQVKTNFFARILRNVWRTAKAIVRPSTGHAYEPVHSEMNYCAIKGQVSGVNSTEKGTLIFRPMDVLDGNRRYYVIIKGDQDLNGSQGVKSIYGISMNGEDDETFNGISYGNSKIFSFVTLAKQSKNSGICLVDHISITPLSHLFQTIANDTKDDDPLKGAAYDTLDDSDKVYSAKAQDSKKQTLVPIKDVYDWSLAWNSSNPAVADIVVPAGSTDEIYRIVRTGTTMVEGQTTIRVTLSYVGNNIISAIEPAPGIAQAYLFVCDNPWPAAAVIAGNKTWSPWQDRVNNCLAGTGDCNTEAYNFNFKLYYCRDAGNAGTADDLPAILNSDNSSDTKGVIRGKSAVWTCSLDGKPCPGGANQNTVCGNGGAGKCQPSYLKEIYFFRETVPVETVVFDAVNSDGMSAVISWPVINGVSGYKLYWGKSAKEYEDYAEIYADGTDDHENIVCTAASGEFTCRLSDLINGKTHYFDMTAMFASGGEGDYSGQKSIYITDMTAPEQPTGLAAVAGDKQVALSWNKVASSTGYKVYYGTHSRVYGGSSDAGKDTQVILKGLTNGNTYYFSVSAYDKYKNESLHLAEVSAIPAAGNCGNGTCESGECVSCRNDCTFAGCCNNGTCDNGETTATCPADCPAAAFCGNEICDAGENLTNCLSDCLAPSPPEMSPL